MNVLNENNYSAHNLGYDNFPCPQCSKLLLPEEFNNHLKTCDVLYDDDPNGNRKLSYSVISKNDDSRVLCTTCGRKFMPERIGKHRLVCEKLIKKRPKFDVTKKLYSDIETQSSQVVKSKKKIKFSKEFENKLWNKQHKDFINNLRFARKVLEIEEKGISTISLKPPVNLSEKLIECNNCHRRFAPLPAERHIPKCKDIIHKPKPPPFYREKCDKLPKIAKSKIRDLLFQDPTQNTRSCFITPSSKSIIDNKSISPSSTLSLMNTSNGGFFKAKKIIKNHKQYSKCDFCKSSFELLDMEKHMLKCLKKKRNVDFQTLERRNNDEKILNIFTRDNVGVVGKCLSCECFLVPEAKFCMMCGIKVAL